MIQRRIEYIFCKTKKRILRQVKGNVRIEIVIRFPQISDSSTFSFGDSTKQKRLTEKSLCGS